MTLAREIWRTRDVYSVLAEEVCISPQWTDVGPTLIVPIPALDKPAFKEVWYSSGLYRNRLSSKSAAFAIASMVRLSNVWRLAAVIFSIHYAVKRVVKAIIAREVASCQHTAPSIFQRALRR